MENAAFGDFRILSELGRGSFGTVYKARWKPPLTSRKGDQSEETVVLKRIDFRPWHQEKHKLAAKKEVLMLSKVKHVNIIQYYGSFTHKGALFIVMEFAGSGDLHQYIQKRQRRQAPTPEDTLWRFATQLVDAISHLHSQSIIHRDLKPLNVFLADGDVVKVGDLGVSKLVEEFDQNHTRVGTPLYLAPEQVKHQGYDFKVDIWALGCLLYLLAALEPPFQGHNLIQLGHDIVRRQQKPLSERYSQEWRTLVSQLLTKRPQDRPDIFSIQSNFNASKPITHRDRSSIRDPARSGSRARPMSAKTRTCSSSYVDSSSNTHDSGLRSSGNNRPVSAPRMRDSGNTISVLEQFHILKDMQRNYQSTAPPVPSAYTTDGIPNGQLNYSAQMHKGPSPFAGGGNSKPNSASSSRKNSDASGVYTFIPTTTRVKSDPVTVAPNGIVPGSGITQIGGSSGSKVKTNIGDLIDDNGMRNPVPTLRHERRNSDGELAYGRKSKDKQILQADYDAIHVDAVVQEIFEHGNQNQYTGNMRSNQHSGNQSQYNANTMGPNSYATIQQGNSQGAQRSRPESGHVRRRAGDDSMGGEDQNFTHGMATDDRLLNGMNGMMNAKTNSDEKIDEKHSDHHSGQNRQSQSPSRFFEHMQVLPQNFDGSLVTEHMDEHDDVQQSVQQQMINQESINPLSGIKERRRSQVTKVTSQIVPRSSISYNVPPESKYCEDEDTQQQPQVQKANSVHPRMKETTDLSPRSNNTFNIGRNFNASNNFHASNNFQASNVFNNSATLKVGSTMKNVSSGKLGKYRRESQASTAVPVSRFSTGDVVRNNSEIESSVSSNRDSNSGHPQQPATVKNVSWDKHLDLQEGQTSYEQARNLTISHSGQRPHTLGYGRSQRVDKTSSDQRVDNTSSGSSRSDKVQQIERIHTASSEGQVTDASVSIWAQPRSRELIMAQSGYYPHLAEKRQNLEEIHSKRPHTAGTTPGSSLTTKANTRLGGTRKGMGENRLPDCSPRGENVAKTPNMSSASANSTRPGGSVHLPPGSPKIRSINSGNLDKHGQDLEISKKTSSPAILSERILQNLDSGQRSETGTGSDSSGTFLRKTMSGGAVSSQRKRVQDSIIPHLLSSKKSDPNLMGGSNQDRNNDDPNRVKPQFSGGTSSSVSIHMSSNTGSMNTSINQMFTRVSSGNRQEYSGFTNRPHSAFARDKNGFNNQNIENNPFGNSNNKNNTFAGSGAASLNRPISPNVGGPSATIAGGVLGTGASNANAKRPQSALGRFSRKEPKKVTAAICGVQPVVNTTGQSQPSNRLTVKDL